MGLPYAMLDNSDHSTGNERVGHEVVDSQKT